MVGHVSYEAFGGVPASIDPQVYERLRATGFDGVDQALRRVMLLRARQAEVAASCR